MIIDKEVVAWILDQGLDGSGQEVLVLAGLARVAWHTLQFNTRDDMSKSMPGYQIKEQARAFIATTLGCES